MVMTIAMIIVARKTITVAVRRRAILARCVRPFVTIMATLYAVHRRLRGFIWNVAGRCHTGITVSVWTVARWAFAGVSGLRMASAGGDIVLIAVGTGIVYEILDGVLY